MNSSVLRLTTMSFFRRQILIWWFASEPIIHRTPRRWLPVRLPILPVRLALLDWRTPELGLLPRWPPFHFLCLLLNEFSQSHFRVSWTHFWYCFPGGRWWVSRTACGADEHSHELREHAALHWQARSPFVGLSLCQLDFAWQHWYPKLSFTSIFTSISSTITRSYLKNSLTIIPRTICNPNSQLLLPLLALPHTLTRSFDLITNI